MLASLYSQDCGGHGEPSPLGQVFSLTGLSAALWNLQQEPGFQSPTSAKRPQFTHHPIFSFLLSLLLLLWKTFSSSVHHAQPQSLGLLPGYPVAQKTPASGP